MNKNQLFHPESALGKALLSWWASLEENRGARAELRRAHDLTAVALSGAYQRFYQQMLNVGWPEEGATFRNERLAAIAGLLAHVNSQDEAQRPIAKIMSEGERPPFSELRFCRLLESPTLDDVFIGLRRALPMIGRKANIHQLANDMLLWNDSVKKQWAYAYQWPAKSQV